jgi:hypothetical protein
VIQPKRVVAQYEFGIASPGTQKCTRYTGSTSSVMYRQERMYMMKDVLQKQGSSVRLYLLADCKCCVGIYNARKHWFLMQTCMATILTTSCWEIRKVQAGLFFHVFWSPKPRCKTYSRASSCNKRLLNVWLLGCQQSNTYLWEFLKKILLSRVVGTPLRDTTLVDIWLSWWSLLPTTIYNVAESLVTVFLTSQRWLNKER